MKSDNIMQDRGRLVGRREVMKLTGAALAAPFILRSTRANAGVELVLANWGGEAIPNYMQAFGTPFEKATGNTVTIDGSGPTEGKIKAMVEAGNVTWDICDCDTFTAESLGKVGLMEPIDYSIVDAKKVRPGQANKYSCTNYIFSYVIAYDTRKLKQAPQVWADLWDLEKFPGKRTFWKYMPGVLEAALLADGVAQDKLYPLDVDRAFKKLEQIKDQIVLWESGSDSQSLLRDGEVTVGAIWHTRANLIEADTKGAIKWHFNQAIACPCSWAVPKGARNVKEAMQFIAFAQQPDLQLDLLRTMSNGPANPAASASEPTALAKVDPGNEAHWKMQIPMDMSWYAKNYNTVLNQFLDFFAA